MPDEPPVESQSELTIPSVRPSGLRIALSTSLPPLTAFFIQWLYAGTITRWSLFYPAVFISSWLGGFASGVSATFLSLALVWWYFIPPQETLVKGDVKHILGAAVFVGMGLIVSTLHARLRRANRDATVALVEARRANDRLQRAVNERRILAELIENSSDFIGFANEVGVPIYLNPGGRRMVGLPADFPVETTHVLDYYSKDASEFARDVIAKATIERGSWEGETSFRNWQTQAAIPISTKIFTVREPESGRILGRATVTRDISDMLRARDALERANRELASATVELARSKQRLQAMVDHSPNAVVVKDLQGRYLLMNPALERLLGVSYDVAKGKTDFDLLPRDIAQRHRELDERAIKVAGPVAIEETIEEADGTHLFLVNRFALPDERGHSQGVCAVWADITERMGVEDALARTAADLREAQRVAHVGSWAWDLKTGIARWSEESYRIFGYDSSRPPPRLLNPESQIFLPESLTALRAAIDKTRVDATPYELELELVRPDGTLRWVAVHGEGVRDATGEIVAMNGTAQDITELKHLEQLREEWTSVIAHDLRQPIGIITMSASFLEEVHAGEMSEQERALTRRIASAADSLSRLVNDLSDASLLEAHRLTLERRWVEPRAIVHEAVERLAHLTAGRQVSVSAARDLPRVFVDPVRVEQVLGNLISNAVKYGDPQRAIEVRVERHREEVEIAVANEGRGIPPEDLPRIFRRFVRAKATTASRAPGLGVGLYISKGLIEAHGCRMWAESTPGKTTTFRFTLPTRADIDREAA